LRIAASSDEEKNQSPKNPTPALKARVGHKAGVAGSRRLVAEHLLVAAIG
jgi:hypothetical protein